MPENDPKTGGSVDPTTDGVDPTDAAASGAGSDSESDAEDDPELPPDAREEAERLTRLARNSVDEGATAAYLDHREELLSEYDFTARVREEDPGATLVCHPAEWVTDGTVRIEAIEDTGRAFEIPLEGPADPDDWEAVDAHNRELVAELREQEGEIHAETAAAFADFIANHYAKRVEAATEDEVSEFLTEYFPRNAWPTDEQREKAARSVRLLRELAE